MEAFICSYVCKAEVSYSFFEREYLWNWVSKVSSTRTELLLVPFLVMAICGFLMLKLLLSSSFHDCSEDTEIETLPLNWISASPHERELDTIYTIL